MTTKATLNRLSKPHIVLLLAVLGILLFATTITLAVTNYFSEQESSAENNALREGLSEWETKFLLERGFSESYKVRNEELLEDIDNFAEGGKITNGRLEEIRQRWKRSDTINQNLISDLRTMGLKIDALLDSTGTEPGTLECPEAGKLAVNVQADVAMVSATTANEGTYVQGETIVTVWSDPERVQLLQTVIPWEDPIFIQSTADVPIVPPGRKLHIRFGGGTTVDGLVIAASLSRDFRFRYSPWSKKKIQLAAEVVMFGNQETGGAIVLVGN